MRYCKKCGAEITDGSSFCKKCGNPVQKPSKQESGKKKWVFAICSGIVICAAGITGIFFATGVLGGKGDVGQTGNDISMETGQEENVSESSVKGMEQSADEKTSEPPSQSGNKDDSAREKELLAKGGWKGQTFQKLGCYVMGDWVHKHEAEPEYDYEESDYVWYCYPDFDEDLEEEDCVSERIISISANDNDILVTEENIEYLLGSWEMEDWKLVKEDEQLYIYTQECFDDPDLRRSSPVLSVCVFVKDTYKVYTIRFSSSYLYGDMSEAEDGGKIGPDFGDIAKSKTYKAFIDTIQYLGE